NNNFNLQMMNKNFLNLAAAMAIAISAATFVACGDDDDKSVEVSSVMVTPSTLTLKVGEKQTLNAAVEPQNATDKTVTWSSSAPAIAEVNASTGEVTAIAVGTAGITATTANGKISKCAVTVAENVIGVTGVRITPATLALKAGDKQTLAATVEPENATDKTVTWSSSAATIAEVNASTGEVTAKAVGTATITATAGGVSGTCALTVNAVEVTGITITPAALDLTVGDKQTLAAAVEPENATDKTVTWSSNAADIAEVNASTGEVTAKAVGTATITATAGGVSKTCAVTISPEPEPVLLGSWLFDDPSDFTKAEAGLPLILHGNVTAAEGGVHISGQIGDYYEAQFSGLGTERLTAYTMLIDYRLVDDGQYNWYAVFQTDLQNGHDGFNNEADLWINGFPEEGTIGGAGYYTEKHTIPLDYDNYHRLVIVYKQASMAFYLDGKHIGTTDFSGNRDQILRRLSLDPNGVLLFASGDYVYQSFDISRVSIWDKQLTEAEVTALGSTAN
ncbi:MAG: Ig-like domain-containing protein, partial [Tannerellaceae bacterium]|nr:Ig-like domain-containing protein [Tannerellaceae bacterium]